LRCTLPVRPSSARATGVYGFVSPATTSSPSKRYVWPLASTSVVPRSFLALGIGIAAFIGKNADRLAVTTAWEGLDDEARSMQPQAGALLELGATVRGVFDPRYKL